MANDALDPGPQGNYPHWPRKPDGTPDLERMPERERRRLRHPNPFGELEVHLDLRPRDGNGNLIEPPTL